MKPKQLLYICLFILGLSTIAACNKHTCPTYATSGPTKYKKKKKNKKSAPWHKTNKQKQAKKGSTPL